MKRLLVQMSVTTSMAWCVLAQAPQPAAAPRPDGLYATFQTSMGTIVAQLFEKETPLTVQNFVALAKGTKPWEIDKKTHATVRKPMYNGLIFHRVMLDGMIQSGDPTGTGEGTGGIKLKDEIRPSLKFDQPGRLAMANTGEPNSGSCQWFITQASPIPSYNGGYTIFGQVVEGQDVVKAISRAPGAVAANNNRPKNPPKLISVTIDRVGPPPAAPPSFKKAAPAKK
ncbi:MAG: peptidylprolyl isomerase [Bryobacteraceae bacterium]